MTIFRVGVFGEFSSDNQGDRLIGQGMERLFSELGCAVKLIPLGAIRDQTIIAVEEKAANGFRRFHRKCFQGYKTYRHIVELFLFLTRKRKQQQELQSTLDDLDVVIIGGGQLLGDNSLRMILKVDLVTREAKRKKLGCGLFSIGIDYPGTFISKFFLARILKRLSFDHVFVRDKTSAEVFAKIRGGILSKVRQVPDVALYAPDLQPCIKVHNKVVGLAPQSYRTLSNKIKRANLYDNHWWCELAKQLLAQGAQPVLFSSGVQSDHDRCDDIHNLLKQDRVNIGFIERPETTEQLRDQLLIMSSILVQRLHLSIAYYALGGLPASLGWHSKVDDFYSSIELNERFYGEKIVKIADVVHLLCDGSERSHRKTDLFCQNLSSEARNLLKCLSPAAS